MKIKLFFLLITLFFVSNAKAQHNPLPCSYFCVDRMRSLQELYVASSDSISLNLKAGDVGGCDSSRPEIILYRAIDMGKSVEFCSVLSLRVGSYYRLYFEGRDRNGRLILQPDAAFILDMGVYYRINPFITLSRDIGEENVLIEGFKVELKN